MCNATPKVFNVWTADEDAVLRRAIACNKPKAWNTIAAMLPGRSARQAAHRWQFALAPGLKKGYWTEVEDDLLLTAVRELGPNFPAIAEHIPTRSTKQVRERYMRHLHPSIRHDPFDAAEDTALLAAHASFGAKWARIAKELPGRTPNAVKNRHKVLRRRALSDRSEREGAASGAPAQKRRRTTITTIAAASNAASGDHISGNDVTNDICEETHNIDSVYADIIRFIDTIDEDSGLNESEDIFGDIDSWTADYDDLEDCLCALSGTPLALNDHGDCNTGKQEANGTDDEDGIDALLCELNAIAEASSNHSDVYDTSFGASVEKCCAVA